MKRRFFQIPVLFVAFTLIFYTSAQAVAGLRFYSNVESDIASSTSSQEQSDTEWVYLGNGGPGSDWYIQDPKRHSSDSYVVPLKQVFSEQEQLRLARDNHWSELPVYRIYLSEYKLDGSQYRNLTEVVYFDSGNTIPNKSKSLWEYLNPDSVVGVVYDKTYIRMNTKGEWVSLGKGYFYGSELFVKKPPYKRQSKDSYVVCAKTVYSPKEQVEMARKNKWSKLPTAMVCFVEFKSNGWRMRTLDQVCYFKDGSKLSNSNHSDWTHVLANTMIRILYDRTHNQQMK